MKYFSLVLLGVLLASCRSINEGSIAKDILINRYMSPNGTKNLYVVDSIPYDPQKHVIIVKKQGKPMAYEKDEHRKLGFLRFIVSDDFYNYNTDFSTKSIMADGNNALLIAQLSDVSSRDWHFSFADEDWRNMEFDYKLVAKGKDTISVSTFKTNPSFFRVYLVKGGYLNRLYNHVMDGYNTYWDFPTQEAFYKVFVPVWNSTSEVKPLVTNADYVKLKEDQKRFFYKNKKKIIKKWGY